MLKFTFLLTATTISTYLKNNMPFGDCQCSMNELANMAKKREADTNVSDLSVHREVSGATRNQQKC